MIDKLGFFGEAVLPQPLILELGCGERKRHARAVGIDHLDYPGVDIVGDAFEVLAAMKTATVDQVYAYHFLEHVDDVNGLLTEVSRILKPGGTAQFVVPHFSNPYFYSDITHRSAFGLYTLCYFSAGSPFRRKVPTYQKELHFRLERVDLRFKTAREFPVRYALKAAVGVIFNSCGYLKELYEENFCYLFPCYEISYQLRRI